jgi:hypothetical protein
VHQRDIACEVGGFRFDGSGISCITLSELTDFPQPLSPTSATVSPASTSSEMQSTALVTVLSLKK